jgi:UDPglucose 6-dehydrogenase
MYSVGVCGLGFVGEAIVKSLHENKIPKVCGYDKYKNGSKKNFKDLLKTDFIFFTLPTQYDENRKDYNIDSIKENLEALKKNNYKGIILNKSTVSPKTTQMLADTYGLCMIHNPEFLSSSSAFDDFHNQYCTILGKTTNCTDDQINYIINFYKTYYPKTTITVCTSEESESTKLFSNCFYCVKIQFFNEIYDYCKKTNIDYETVRKLMLQNGWISPMHTLVPGPDGLLSYGGYCFPKDSLALLEGMNKNNVINGVLKAAISERGSMREDNFNIIKKK